MNLNQLKIFYLAIKQGSLSAAADELNITQPAVTKGIQRLQEYYEVKFVERFGRKLELTFAGKGLYEISEKIFELEGLAEDYLRDFQQHKRGHIRIVSSETFGTYYLPFIVNRYSLANPQIRLTVKILPNEDVVKRTVAHLTDLGFLSYPFEHKNLFLKEVLEEKLVIIFSPEHHFSQKDRIEPYDLEGQSIIMHEKGAAPQMIIDELVRKNNVSIFKYLEFSNNEAIKRAVESGVGIAIISEKVASEEIKSGKLKAIEFSDGPIRRKFYMAYNKDKFISDSLQSLIDSTFRWAARFLQVSF